MSKRVIYTFLGTVEVKLKDELYYMSDKARHDLEKLHKRRLGALEKHEGRKSDMWLFSNNGAAWKYGHAPEGSTIDYPYSEPKPREEREPREPREERGGPRPRPRAKN